MLRWGISLGWLNNDILLPGGLHFRAQTLATTTPVDDRRCRLVLRHRVRELPLGTPLALRGCASVFNTTLDEDVVIWENKIYRTRPVASRSDWAIMRFRGWARQFYDPTAYDAAMGRLPRDPAELSSVE